MFGTEGKMANRTAKFPDRKISETLLHFAGITPHDLPNHAPERRAREALTVACTVWNAVIFADLLNDPRHLDEARRLIAGTPEAAVLVEQLIVRKRTLFADDERLIGNFEVTRTTEGINVHAEARNPHSLPKHPA
jgi:hypothetical protein